jgi:hypothetical protein
MTNYSIVNASGKAMSQSIQAVQQKTADLSSSNFILPGLQQQKVNKFALYQICSCQSVSFTLSCLMNK